MRRAAGGIASTRRRQVLPSAEVQGHSTNEDADLDLELASTRPILDRVPMDRADWTPHATSMSNGAFASHLANLPQFGTTMGQTDALDMAAGFDNPWAASQSARAAAGDVHRGTARALRRARRHDARSRRRARRCHAR